MELTVTSLLTSVWLLSSIYFYRQQQPAKLASPPADSSACLVAYASQTGQARQIAEQLAEQLAVAEATDSGRQPLNIQLANVAQLSLQDLRGYQRILFIVSTAGHGEPPDCARAFSHALRRLKAGALQHTRTRFAILALGDSSYDHFCAYGRWLESQLVRCGLTQLWPRTDVNRCARVDLQQWYQHLSDHFSASTAIHSGFGQQRPVQHRYQLLQREALNPGSPNAGLFKITLGAMEPAKVAAGDIIDIHIANQQVRSYSLANAPGPNDDHKLELIVRQHTRPDGTPGLGSYYLTERIDAASEIRLSVRRGTPWSAPAHALPWILIAAGSGLAGIRSALHWRAQQAEQHPTWVIFGERDPDYDRPCYQELADFRQQGVISNLDYVWSQHPHQRAYVQDILLEHPQRLRHYLLMGGLIYVCGSATSIGEGVDATLHTLLGEHAMQVLAKQSRYWRDIY